MGDTMITEERKELPDYSEWLLYLNGRGNEPKEKTTPTKSISPFEIGMDQPGHTYAGALQGAGGPAAQKQAIEFGERTGKAAAEQVIPGGSLFMDKAIEKSRKMMPGSWRASLNTTSATPPEKPGFVKSVLGSLVDLIGQGAGMALPGAGAGLGMAIGIPSSELKSKWGLGSLKDWATGKIKDTFAEKEAMLGPRENFSGRGIGRVADPKEGESVVTGPGRNY